MPLQDYGRYMMGSAEMAAAPANALLGAYDNAQQNARRNALTDIAQQRTDIQWQQAQQDRAAQLQGAQAEQQKAAEVEQARAILAAGRSGNPAARAYALKFVISKAPPEVQAGMAQADPEQLWNSIEPALAQAVGEKPQPGPVQLQEQPGPFGSRIVTGGDRWQVVEPPKPQGGGMAKPGYGAPEKGTNPQTGKPDMFVIDDMGNPKWLGIEPPAPQQALSPKDTSAALQKRNQIRLARQQLALARQKFGAIQNSFSAGPGGKMLPTPAGKAFDASIDSMRNTITAITRVPGVGAMSDYETRLAQAQFPERGNYESVTAQQLQSIEDMLNALDQGYSDLLGGTQSQTPAAPKERPPLESFKRK